jgi:sigma-B regulation protein RsbU (phosphoserine phosphatase)
MEQQNGMFFTMWYGVYNRSSRELAYACAGHPPALLFAGQPGKRARMTQLHTPNLFIGGMPDITFEEGVTQLTEPCSLYVFSDGVFEILRPDGSIWDFSGFMDFMAEAYAAKEPVGARLLGHVQEMSSTETMEDDFSILEIHLCDTNTLSKQ